MNLAYIRVSTMDQNLDRQLENLKKYNIDKIFKEKVSGKNMDRAELKKLLDFAREGDTVYVDDFSRLARSVKDLLEITETLEKKGVHLVSCKESLDTSTPVGKMMLTMIGAIAEFERNQILERQREGIAIAKAKGKYQGRKRKKIDEAEFNRLYEAYDQKLITKIEFADKLEVSRPTLDKLFRERNLR